MPWAAFLRRFAAQDSTAIPFFERASTYDTDSYGTLFFPDVRNPSSELAGDSQRFLRDLRNCGRQPLAKAGFKVLS